MLEIPHVLIVTYGRSGSTLLQGVLNAIPGWLIRGENYNFAFDLYAAYNALARAQSKHGHRAGRPTRPWYGAAAIDLDGFRRACRDAIDAVLLSGVDPTTVRCCGFKEIRYIDILRDDPDGETLAGYLHFLQTCLAPCRLVFLSRDHARVARSDWWTQWPEAMVRQRLEAFDRFAAEYCSAAPDSCFAATYECIVAGEMEPLFRFLGTRPHRAALAATLQKTHSSRAHAPV